ncbi:MAG: hypothetical protein D6769_00270 [Methanobacteriota archaeon]|nr:MAG: hypothetical protein D6769_00270 [Euryarchaeota archaeon]
MGVTIRKLSESTAKDTAKRSIEIRKKALSERRLGGVYKDQLPDIIGVTNTPYLDISHALYGINIPQKEGVLTGGFFGQVSMVSTPTDLEWVKDYEQFAYMMNHLEEHGKRIPFILFVGEDSSAGFRLIRERKEVFLKRLCESGRIYDKQMGRVFANYDGGVVKIPLLLTLFNREERAFYVIDQFNNKVRLVDWLRTIKTPNEELKEELIEKFEAFEKDGKEIKKELSQIALSCCDARAFGFGEEEYRVKTLGALLSRKRMKVMLRNKLRKGSIIYEVHTRCGYMTSAVQFYQMVKLLQKKEESRVAVFEELSKALKGEHAMRLDISHARNLPSNYRELFERVFCSPNNDFQDIMLHMFSHLNILELGRDKKEVKMPAYDRIMEVMKEKDIVYSPEVQVYLVTEELLIEQIAALSTIAATINGASVEVDVYPTMFSLADFKRYNLPLDNNSNIASLESRVVEEEELTRINEFGEEKKVVEILGL